MKQKMSGFTLIELMMVVALMGILFAIALPSYNAHVLKSNRSDAKIALTTVSQRIERCYTSLGTYTPSEEKQCVVIDQVTDSGIYSDEGYYLIKLAEDDQTSGSYTIRATPVTSGRQAKDEQCVELSLDNIGNKKSHDKSGNDTSDTCW